MTSVSQVKSVAELIKLWPRLVRLSVADCPRVAPDDLLVLFLTCLKSGAVFVIRTDSGLAGSCCVEKNCTSAVLHSIPPDNGARLGKTCLEAVVTWAKDNSLTSIRVTTTKLCGSSFKYFTKSLGFRKKAVTFTMEI